MKIIRLIITMEDYPEVKRVIEMRDDQNFEVLHQAILSAVDFDFSQLASFYVCNDEWEREAEVTLIDMDPDEGSVTTIMKDTNLRDFIKKAGQKLVYEYDFVLMWQFRLEVESVKPADNNDKSVYPLLVHSEGQAPEQYETRDKYPQEVTEEDTKYINELKVKNLDFFHRDKDELSENTEKWGDDDLWESEDKGANYWDDEEEY